MSTVRRETPIWLDCHECGPVPLVREDITIVSYRSGRQDSYRFTCPGSTHQATGRLVLEDITRVDFHQLRIIDAVGVECQTVDDLRVADTVAFDRLLGGDPVTYREYNDFHQQLEKPGTFEAALDHELLQPPIPNN